MGCGAIAGWPVMGPALGASASPPLTLVMSWMLDRRLSLFMELRRIKYFWAWLATCVGVREMTKLREMLRQSPFPNLASPSRNNLEAQWQAETRMSHLPPQFQHLARAAAGMSTRNNFLEPIQGTHADNAS